MMNQSLPRFPLLLLQRAIFLRWFAVATALLACLPSFTHAQSVGAIEAVRRQLSHEPAVGEVTRQSLHYFRVDPDSFDALRTSARTRALLPLLAGGFRVDLANFDRFEDQRIFQPRQIEEATDTQVLTFSLGAVWDLRELVFNAAEVQVYGLIGVQRDLMLETVRTYFLRRQLMLRLQLRPPEDALAYAALELRIQEFTAVLDVLTGNWFSEEAERRQIEAEQESRRRRARRGREE